MTERKPTLFITGNSSGLGRGLSEVYLEKGWRVFGCSRRGCDLGGDIRDARIDLTDYDALPGGLGSLLGEADRIDLAVLNAGMLGEIRDLHETPLDDLRRIMEVNLWSQKAVLDWLHGCGKPVERIVLISSGAAVNGNRGWGGYALSKAAFVMMGQLYAHEFPDTHIVSLAPGLIDTRMQDYICGEADAERYESLKRLRAARGTESMPGPREAAERIVEVMPRLAELPSGGFVDIRKL